VLASAFAVVFGVFVAAFVALCVLVVSWAVRRDRARWREWRDRPDRRDP
jgi:ABC-type Fe3+ transport system permease subunit